MMNPPLPEAKIIALSAEIQGVMRLQPALTQLAEQLAEIESKLMNLRMLSSQVTAFPLEGAGGGMYHPKVKAQWGGAATTGQSARLKIYCFGRFEVYDGDQSVVLQRAGKGNLILKFLTISRSPVLRDVLLETMWPESDPQVANNRLKVAIHHLRKSFAQSLANSTDAEIVSFRDGVYMLNPELEIWTDVHEFETLWQSGRQLERAGRLDEAADCYLRAEALYRGDLLEQDVFEEWTLVQRESFKDIYLTLLDKLAEHYMRTHETERAIEKWKKIIEKDACREDAYRHLISCYADRGQRALALRWYEACVTALREQLGVEPEPETVALYKQLRRRDKAAA
jgi:DNA-binding SARP family transcriptional activator